MERHIIVLNESAKMDDVVKALESIGLKVLARLEYLRMLIVEGSNEAAEKAKSIEGVKEVEKNKKIGLL